jgi:mono/diheme cytochrome c family protein
MRWVLLVAVLGIASVGHNPRALEGSAQPPVSQSQSDAAIRSAVTFTRDVAPIVYASCVTCHRPAGSAPFSLLTYEEARGRAAQIAASVERRVMPPWPPEPGHGEFTGNRRLSEIQIATIRRWVDGGAVEGDPDVLPPRPSWSGRWQLGEPDLILQTGEYTLRAAGDDMYRNFVLPIPGGETRYVKAWEFLPGNTRVVHHATSTHSIRSRATRDSFRTPLPVPMASSWTGGPGTHRMWRLTGWRGRFVPAPIS